MSTQPSCFAKHWDPNAVECKGGLDAAYENPRDKTHRRDRCAWFAPCSQTMTYAPQTTPQQPPSQQIIPARSLLQRPAVDTPPSRPQYQPPQPPFSPPRLPTHIPPPQPSYQQYQHQYSTAPPPQPMPQYAPVPMNQAMVHPAVAQYGPQLVYQPYQLPGAQMPNYLTVPEPVLDGDQWGYRLGRELARSVGKALGHTLAAFFDSNPIRRHRQQ